MKVKAWREKVIIPTYDIGKAEKNPIFLEKRVYQGSSGVVYPNPVIEKIEDEKYDKEWNAIYIENKYIKIMVLPELGGRIQMAYDKIKQRHFVYYNQVIKPALVGLTGPWISGGIEFNWPQHHRPSTYEPVDSEIEENNDGSVTVWCSEVERMFRTKGMAGFTLYPDKAYMEIRVKIYNRTPHPQTFLWWANPAVKVNDDYQSVFPPDVNAVFDHGKRDVARFPIATGEYYKVDYSSGVDISKYKNIPVPTSYMAIKSKYNFVGGFENDSQGGLLHVADHHQSPGKKQWTWGNGDFGQAWDRNLTDEDGPYIELMCGVYTDNQPDFTWLQPYEEKSFKQYFMPYRDLGVVKNATKEAMINIEEIDSEFVLKAYTTAVYDSVRGLVKRGDNNLVDEIVNFSPEMSYQKRLTNKFSFEQCCVQLISNNGKVLVEWESEIEELKPQPDPAKPAKDPSEINSNEQLFLQGQHLEQYRHATYNPIDYYLEALDRDPSDVRCNNAMGLLLLRRGKFEEAENYFRKAVEAITERNPNPYDGEPLYNLACSLKVQNKLEQAYNYFNKATWNAAWQDSGYFHAAQIDSIRNDYERALELIERSLNKNWLNQKARHLKVVLLRKLDRKHEALDLIEESLLMDKFNFGILLEKYLITNNETCLDYLLSLLRNNVHNYIEFSLDYAQAGFYNEAANFISIYTNNNREAYPMALYFEAYYAEKLGESKKAFDIFEKAAKSNSDYCFPNKIEELVVLQKAVSVNLKDAKAWYYMGNFWYASRQYDDAIQAWECSREIDSKFPTVHRNLALAYYNKQSNKQNAKLSLEKAFRLDTSDARVLMELDQLYKKLNYDFETRLKLLDQHPNEVEYRDDLYLEKVSLHNLIGEHQKALNLMMSRKFHPWEGGEGKVTGQYLLSHIQLAKLMIANKQYNEAINHLKSCFEYPHNLGEGKLAGAQECDVNYWLGCVYEALGKNEIANNYWQKASDGIVELSAAMYYNDQQPDQIFYKALAFQKLGEDKKAKSIFYKLLNYGEKNLFVPFKMDYFAVSLPDLLIFEDDLQVRHEMHCYYLMALGNLGLNNLLKAKQQFDLILSKDKYHLGAIVHNGLLR
jgi:tetratricopeptide (TPR) repeat protein